MAASGVAARSGRSRGIAEALITTAFGSIVAIPRVALQLLHDQNRLLSVEMTYTSKELNDYLIKSVGSELAARSSRRNSRRKRVADQWPCSH